MASGAGIQIDSLIVSLGLDPSKFTQGQAAAVASFKALQQNATKQAKQFEEAANRIMNFMSRIRAQAIGFAAAAFGAHGISEFVQKVTSSNAALDRASRAFGVSTEEMSLWGTAAKLAGGSVEGMQQTIINLTREFKRYGFSGNSEVIKFFRALRTPIADASGNLKSFSQIFMELAREVDTRSDKAEAAELLRGAGLTEDAVNLILRGEEAVRKYLETSKQLNIVNKETADNSALLETKWNTLKEASEGLGNRLVSLITPALGGVADWLNKSIIYLNKTYDIGKKQAEEIQRSGGLNAVLRARSDVGTASPAMAALAGSLQNSFPGFNRATSFNDVFHKGTGSKHEQGLAMDFTIKDPSQHAAAEAALRKRLNEMGAGGASILNHYDPKNAHIRSSAPHFHVSFPNQGAADAFLAAGAGRSALGSGGGGSTTEVNIAAINIFNAPGADSQEIGRNVASNLRNRLRLLTFTGSAQAGPS